MLRAIETSYRGYRFRSRLEARWAVVFDGLGFAWQYEAEGYVLPSGTAYLPDFWLPDFRIFVEVKGAEATDDERQRCRELTEGSGRHTALLQGGIPERPMSNPHVQTPGIPTVVFVRGHPEIDTVIWGSLGCTDGREWDASPILAAALTRARAERFDRFARP